MPDWTQEFFTPLALDAWQRSQSREATQQEAAFLADALELGPAPGALLDVPCGDGRHAVELAKLGHRVTGLDIADENRTRAQRRAADAGVTLDFLVGDMRSLPERPPFDGAYCMGNSFGYFPRAESQRFVTAVARALRPGARFVIDTESVAESILLDLNRRTWLRVDDELTVLLASDYDPAESRLDATHTTLRRDRVVDRRTSHHYVLTSGELVSMLQAAGMRTVALLGDLDGAPFELGSERLLLIAERNEG
jgi:SAM-dependent methyltransferase